MRLFGALLLLTAVATAVPAAPRQTVTIGSDWRFTVDIEKLGENIGGHLPFEFDVTGRPTRGLRSP